MLMFLGERKSAHIITHVDVQVTPAWPVGPGTSGPITPWHRTLQPLAFPDAQPWGQHFFKGLWFLSVEKGA